MTCAEFVCHGDSGATVLINFPGWMLRDDRASLLVCSDARWARLLRRRAGDQSALKKDQVVVVVVFVDYVGGQALPRTLLLVGLEFGLDRVLCASLRYRQVLTANSCWIKIFFIITSFLDFECKTASPFPRLCIPDTNRPILSTFCVTKK